MSPHLVRLRGRGAHATRSIATPHPRAARAAAARVADALGAPLQAKLSLGAPNDAHEREADAVAERVMRLPDGAAAVGVAGESLQRKCAECDEEDAVRRQATGEEDEEPVQRQSTGEEEQEEIQAKAGGEAGDGALASETAAQIQSARGRGQALPAGERNFFGPRLGADLSRVRVHDDSNAAQLNRQLGARAFTVGRDIFFGRGQYQPATASGRQLMAHELTHVLQQDRAGTVRRTIDWIDADAEKKTVDMYLSLGIYGKKASSSLASKWRGYIENNWSQKLKTASGEIKARMHATVTAYPGLPDQFSDPKHCPKLPGDQTAHAGISEANAIAVTDKSCSSVVDYRCDWGFDNFSCGRWTVDSEPLVIAHETGHLMGLVDRYTNSGSGSVDNPGFEKDIMANVWNDAGTTDFSRAWVASIFHFFTGKRF